MHSSPQTQLATNNFVISIILPFPKYYKVGIMKYVDLQNGYFHLILHVFILLYSLFLLLKSISLYRCTIMYLSIDVLSDVFVVSSFSDLK